MGKLPIALQLYSVRDAMEQDVYNTLKAVKAMGYDGVEFAGLYGQSPKQLKQWCAELEIIPYSAHVPRPEMIADLPGVIGAYAEIGCRFIAIPWSDQAKDIPGRDGYQNFLEDVRKISAECKKHNIRLLYHNHDFEFEKIDGVYKLDIFYSDTTADEIQTEIDTCWASVGGENPAEFVRKYTQRAPVVHLKDYVGSQCANMYDLIASNPIKTEAEASEKFEFRPVGCGVQNVLEILKAAEDAGAELVVVEQDNPSMGHTSMECAKISLDNIKKVY